MADATTISRLTLVQENPLLFLSSHILCPHRFPRHALLAHNNGGTRKSSWKPSSQFPQARFRSISAHSSPAFVNSAVVSRRVGGGGGGGWHSASSHIVHASSRSSSSSREDTQIDSPPSSKEETVQQAGASLLILLDKTLKQQGPTTVKRRKSQRQIRLRIDIPLLDDSRQALLTLTRDLLDSFVGGKSFPGKVAVYFSDPALLVGADSPPESATYQSLEGSEALLPKDAVVALVIAPRFQQAASLESVVKNAGVRPVVVVNPEWSEDEEQDKGWGALLTSFCVAYSFIPLNIQGFFSKTEGAVLKRARSGAPEGQPWLIFVKEGDNYKCVSRLKKRPTPTDLENAFYSSMAANSPVNKSIAFLRGLTSK